MCGTSIGLAELSLEGVLGVGATATVVRGRTREGRALAVKLLHPRHMADPSKVAAFAREAGALGKVDSPFVPRLVGSGASDDGQPYLVMDLLEGQDLGRAVGARRVAVQTCVDHVRDACHGALGVHRAGLVHGDIKPGNLFLASRPVGPPRVMLLDLGVAAAIGSRAPGAPVVGSLDYMAPERFDDAAPLEVTADVWSLGVVLFELLTGRAPFPAASGPVPPALVAPPTKVSALAPALPSALAEIVMRCLARAPEARFPSALALADALEPHASNPRDVETVPPPPA